MSDLAKTLKSVHKCAGSTLGEIALAISAERGVTPRRLEEWAESLRDAADMLHKTSPRLESIQANQGE